MRHRVRVRPLPSFGTDILFETTLELATYVTMFMYPPPFCGPIHHSPGFPYNTGAVPEFAAMPGIRPVGMGLNMPMHPGLSPMAPGMLYGYHPGMMAPNMGLDPGTMMASDQATPSDKATGSPAQSPASHSKTIGRRGAAYPDGRKDVRFAGPSAAVSNLTPKR